MNFAFLPPFAPSSRPSPIQYVSPGILSTTPLHPRHVTPKLMLTPSAESPITIPEGAKLEPVFTTSSLSHRLETLTFSYERPSPTPTLSPGRTLRYRCRHGHLITIRPNSPACQFCPVCQFFSKSPCLNNSRSKLTLCQLSHLAQSRGGRLVSTVYINARTPLLWCCKKGHYWLATASNIRSAESWCPECARQRRKLTIADMQALAKERGGVCLSSQYLSGHNKLLWRCRKGHEFLMAPNNISRKPSGSRKPSWCKLCRAEARAAQKHLPRGKPIHHHCKRRAKSAESCLK